MSHTLTHQHDDELDEDEDESDEEYNMEQYGMRQALPVPDGEPDWGMEEPDSVEEYLRRVRWEAARVPKVVTAAIDASTFAGQQTAYIPKLDALPQPPAWAEVDRDWVKQFVLQFQQLRLYLAQVAEATVYSAPTLPHLNDVQAWDRLCFGRGMAGAAQESSSVGGGDALASASSSNNGDAGAGDAAAGEAEEEFPVPGPVMRILQQLDQVAVVSLLLRHVDQLAAGAALTLLRSQWLFALAARVDKPLHAETAAALRQLLRRCCSLRAGLQQYDDPTLPLLNILIAVAGAYFGQDEELTRLVDQELL